MSPSTSAIINTVNLWWEYVDPERLTSEEEFEAMSDESKIQVLRDCGMEVDDTVACPSCGQRPEWRECDTCGTQAWIVDCGHKAQPRPICGDDIESGKSICDACYEARAERSKTASTLGRKGGLKGGRSTSEAKQVAVRNNGQKGGRPRRTIRVRNVYTGQAFVLCVRHEKANVVGSSVHEMVGDVQVQGPGPDGGCEACEAGLPDGTRAGVSLTMAQRCNIPEAIAQRLRELVVGGDARSRSRHLELLRNEVRRVLLGDRLRGPNRTLPGGMTTRQIVSILQQEGLL